MCFKILSKRFSSEYYLLGITAIIRQIFREVGLERHLPRNCQFPCYFKINKANKHNKNLVHSEKKKAQKKGFIINQYNGFQTLNQSMYSIVYWMVLKYLKALKTSWVYQYYINLIITHNKILYEQAFDRQMFLYVILMDGNLTCN